MFAGVRQEHAYQSSSEQKFYGLQLGDQLRGFWHLQRVQRLASESAVAIFSISSCCMFHVAKRLLLELGVSPTLITCHIDGSLVPLLKQSGALWL
ncbi:hypothetical protein SUGI_0221420 [Cryptomeria japonica]|nr:hypothetical protein SUGI_0221420 [Cryptomeria japonica]